MAAPIPKPNPSSTVSLKLLIDPKSQRVLFAEAGKDFVDFLFYIMSLPVANVIRLLGKQGTVGCIGNIYDSIENLCNSYMLSEAEKGTLLKPTLTNYAPTVDRLLPRMECSSHTKLYKCYRCPYVVNVPNTCCPACRASMDQSLTFVNPEYKAVCSSKGGFVKEAIPYMVMDDLMVRPLSAKSIFTLLSKFDIKDVSDLEEKVIAVGVHEGVELLRASMQSKTVLSDVLLGGKESSVKSEPL